MNIINPQTLEDFVLKELEKSPIKISELMAVIQKTRPRTTPQGINRVLRKLESQAIVFRANGYVTIDAFWVDAVRQYINTVEKSLYGFKSSYNFFQLQDEESVTFEFKNAYDMNRMWAHVLQLMFQNGKKCLYGIGERDWFSFITDKNQRHTTEFAVQYKRHTLLMAGGKGVRARQAKQLIKNLGKDFVQYYVYTKLPFTKQSTYISVVDSFVCEVSVSRKTQTKINKWFEIEQEVTQKDKEELVAIIKTPGRAKLKITNSKQKADEIIKKLVYNPQ